ncbi:hypothetical protein ACFPRL_30250 [Pseudoclavibacter helvolus]
MNGFRSLACVIPTSASAMTRSSSLLAGNGSTRTPASRSSSCSPTPSTPADDAFAYTVACFSLTPDANNIAAIRTLSPVGAPNARIGASTARNSATSSTSCVNSPNVGFFHLSARACISSSRSGLTRAPIRAPTRGRSRADRRPRRSSRSRFRTRPCEWSTPGRRRPAPPEGPPPGARYPLRAPPAAAHPRSKTPASSPGCASPGDP